jgi:hypothetical protein
VCTGFFACSGLIVARLLKGTILYVNYTIFIPIDLMKTEVFFLFFNPRRILILANMKSLLGVFANGIAQLICYLLPNIAQTIT